MKLPGPWWQKGITANVLYKIQKASGCFVADIGDKTSEEFRVAVRNQ